MFLYQNLQMLIDLSLLTLINQSKKNKNDFSKTCGKRVN